MKIKLESLFLPPPRIRHVGRVGGGSGIFFLSTCKLFPHAYTNFWERGHQNSCVRMYGIVTTIRLAPRLLALALAVTFPPLRTSEGTAAPESLPLRLVPYCVTFSGISPS